MRDKVTMNKYGKSQHGDYFMKMRNWAKNLRVCFLRGWVGGAAGSVSGY